MSLAAQKGVKKFVLVRRWLSTPYCCMRGKPCQPMPVSKDGTAPACLVVSSAASSGVGRLGKVLLGIVECCTYYNVGIGQHVGASYLVL